MFGFYPRYDFFSWPATHRMFFWRFDRLIWLMLGLVLLLALLLFSAPARAAQCNTIFLTDKNGNISFPLCPPNRANGTPGFIDNMIIGQSVPAIGNFSKTTVQQGTPATLNTTGTLTAAQISAGIITSTAAAAVVATLPLATAMDTANPNAVATTSIDFFVINTSSTGANILTMTTNTGWTLVGNMVLTPLTTGGVSGHFRATKTGVGTWTLYRLV
jgi:hypothetical protein